MKKILAMMIIVPFLLTGCSQHQTNTATNKVLSDGTTPVTWTSLPSSEQQAIHAVAKHYGEANPKVVYVRETKTDADQKLMYVVELKGHFHQGKVQSNDLEFSILGDGSLAWAIDNKNWSFKDTQLKLK